MPHVPALRSVYEKTGRLIYFGRMLDKIRLHAAGKLPADYHPNIGKGFDSRCCRLLGVDFQKLVARVAAGGTDEQILEWCYTEGGPRTDDQCYVWNRFMMKIGWRDENAELLRRRIVESNLVGKPIETFADLIEFDEGRDPVAARSWEKACQP